jgi:hypothetical protein
MAETPAVTIDAAHPQVDVVLHLAEPAWISGRVLDERGQPVSSASVNARGEELAVHWGPRPDPGPVDLWGGTENVSIAADGSFTLGPLHAQGRYDVWARVGSGAVLAARGVPAGTRDLVLACGGPDERNASVDVFAVSGVTNRAVPKFEVSAADRARDGWRQPWSASSSDGTGVLSLERELAGTELSLLVTADGLGSAVVDNIKPTVEGTAIKVVLPELASLDVTVTDAGAPAPYAIVAVRRSDTSPLRTEREFSVRVDANGHARLRELDPGRYAVVALRGDHMRSESANLAPGRIEALSLDLR